MWGRIGRRAALVALAAYDWVLARLGKLGPYGVLTLDLSGEISEDGAESRFPGPFPGPWTRASTDYLDLVTVLRWATDDPAVRGVLLRCESVGASWARIQGLRRSLQELREAGKKVWFHLDSAGLQEYYLASVAERVVLTPAATLDVAGLSSESVFLLDLLQKLGIEADVVQCGRYKSAGEMFTRRDLSPPHREMVESLVGDLFEQVVGGVAESRGIEVDAAREALGGGPYLAADARELGLIDALSFADETEAALCAACGDAETIDRGDYAQRRGRIVRRIALRGEKRGIALVHVSGTIKMGESVSGFDGPRAVGVQSLQHALEEIRERDDIDAVVARVSSPGGSGVASSLIWREFVLTAEKKPLFFSFGDVAASGGYYVALAAKRLFAEPGTITGSIGVVAGKATLRGLYDKIGVRKELIGRGAHAGMHSDYVPLGESERASIERQASAFYDDFIDKVAHARDLSREEADAVAQGRVWSGRQALQRGLVDEMGGIEQALHAAKREIGVAEDAPVAVERFPRPRPFWRTAIGRGLGATLHAAWPRAGKEWPKPPIDVLGASWPVLASSIFGRTRERIWAILPIDIDFR